MKSYLTTRTLNTKQTLYLTATFCWQHKMDGSGISLDGGISL